MASPNPIPVSHRKLYVATSLPSLTGTAIGAAAQGFEIVTDPSEAELMIFDLDHPPSDWANYLTNACGVTTPLDNCLVLHTASPKAGTKSLIYEQIKRIFGPRMQYYRDKTSLEKDLDLLRRTSASSRKSVREQTLAFVKMPTRSRVFVSYSHHDREWLERLRTMCVPIAGKVDFWDDTRIEAGQLWREEIQTALETSSLAVLLVTPEFLASKFINTNELPRLLETAKGGALTILWVAVKSSLYKLTPIEKYQCVNDPFHPLDSLERPQQDAELEKLAEKISNC